MTSMNTRLFLGLLLAASLLRPLHAAGPAIPDAESSAPQAGRALSGPSLLTALRKGGYVIYFRHAKTDFSKTDAGMQAYEDCANQRMLSDEGRAMARQTGEHIRALRLPAGEVLASPYCRTMESAQLMFQRAQPRKEIREEQGADYPGLKSLLAAPVPQGSLRWIVGHGTPFRSIAGPPHLGEGEAAVLLPQSTSWTVVARLMPGDWQKLQGKP
jgi:phosphohistidine phosphatase SixA